jgi:tRNA wybutosine-synthesizing protein 3
MPATKPSLPPSFLSKKRKILEKLALPVSDYDDLSPKGSIDEGIRDLIDEINQIEGCVTTSSCAGRISVFQEGKKRSQDGDDDEDEDGEEVETRAGVGGKGGGGKWLFVSHHPLDWTKHEDLAVPFSMHRSSSPHTHWQITEELGSPRWVHFKFEPMVSATTPFEHRISKHSA